MTHTMPESSLIFWQKRIANGHNSVT